MSESNEDTDDDDDDIEEKQPSFTDVTKCLTTVIKFFEMEDSTTESDISKLFYYKDQVNRIKVKRAKQVTLDQFFKKQ